jgi:hypothetical protein
MPRRPFASAYRHPVLGVALVVIGLVLVVLGCYNLGTGNSGNVVYGLTVGVLSLMLAIYLLRGRGVRPKVLPQPGPTQDELIWVDGVEYALRKRGSRDTADVAAGRDAAAGAARTDATAPATSTDVSALSGADPAASVADPAASTADPVEELQNYKRMLDAGLITQADYDAAKAKALGL